MGEAAGGGQRKAFLNEETSQGTGADAQALQRGTATPHEHTQQGEGQREGRPQPLAGAPGSPRAQSPAKRKARPRPPRERPRGDKKVKNKGIHPDRKPGSQGKGRDTRWQCQGEPGPGVKGCPQEGPLLRSSAQRRTQEAAVARSRRSKGSFLPGPCSPRRQRRKGALAQGHSGSGSAKATRGRQWGKQGWCQGGMFKA